MANNAPENLHQDVYHDRPNEVISATPVELVMLKRSNSENKVEVVLCASFGTDAEDGGAGVFILVHPDQLSKNLVRAREDIRVRVRQELNHAAAAQPPAEVPDLDLSDLSDGNNTDPE